MKVKFIYVRVLVGRTSAIMVGIYKYDIAVQSVSKACSNSM